MFEDRDCLWRPGSHRLCFQIKTALLNLPVSVLAICVVVVYRFPVGFSVICNPMGDFLFTSKEKNTRERSFH